MLVVWKMLPDFLVQFPTLEKRMEAVKIVALVDAVQYAGSDADVFFGRQRWTFRAKRPGVLLRIDSRGDLNTVHYVWSKESRLQEMYL